MTMPMRESTSEMSLSFADLESRIPPNKITSRERSFRHALDPRLRRALSLRWLRLSRAFDIVTERFPKFDERRY